VRDFDAVLTGLSTGRQKVWIAPVGTPAPDQVFDEDVMRATGWRNVGTLDSVLYVEDQAELDRAIAQRQTLAAALSEVELDAKLQAAGLDPLQRETYIAAFGEPAPRSANLRKPGEANEIPDEEDFGLTQG
jgi:hypothetical protein